MNPPDTILVIVTRRIGDVMMSTPLIESLHAAWPDAAIDVLVYSGTEACITTNPHITRIHAIEETSSLAHQAAFIMSIVRKYDIALSTQPGDRQIFYAVLAGRKSFGLVEKELKQAWKRLILSGWREFDNRDTHTVLMNLALADALDIEKRYDMVVSWSRRQEERLERLLPFDKNRTRYAVLHPCPRFTYKMWRAGAWGELGHALEKQGYRIVATGGGASEEIDYIAGILPTFPAGTTDMSGKLDLIEVACLISSAGVYVGPDTSVTHLAAALGTPTVALYGPTNPVKWGPWPRGRQRDRNPYRRRGSFQRAENVILLQGEQECVPCAEEGCDRNLFSKSRCLQSIPVERVLEAISILVSDDNNR